MQAFYESQISIDKISRKLTCLKKKIYSPVVDLKISYSRTKEPIPYNERLELENKSIQTGEKWGELWDCAWFHFTYKDKLPETTFGKKLVLIIDINGEGCLFDNNGTPIRGITNVSSHFEMSLGTPGKRVIPFVENAKGSETVDLWVDAGCNDLFGIYKGEGKVNQAQIAVCNDELRELYYDFWVLVDLVKVLNKDSARYSSLLIALDKVSNILVNYTDDEIKEANIILKKQLSMKSGHTGLKLTATGHAHLDLAWLWPIRETKRKAARTFSTALEMIERYPNYIFGASQPQQFEWIKESYPALFERIKQKVKEGRIELQGAMWVEPDLNVSGGEALIRQILVGNQYWKEEFGQHIDIAHIPDVFGFNAALPQILKKSCIDKLLTIKMSWNKHNPFPYHTFNWEGIDGSNILVHMPPEGTYNSSCAPRAINFAERNYLDKGVCDEAVILYGIGDGGGGPSTEHLESLKRIENLSGISPVKSGTTKSFFDRIEKNKADYQTYKGEMYLEKHQGTYTTQAKNKYYNRLLERLLFDAELACTMAFKQNNFDYPYERLKKIWKEVLLYQFHDILPGSSIKRVYDESVERYLELEKEVLDIIKSALNTFPKNNSYVFNPLIFGSQMIEEVVAGKATCSDTLMENDYLIVTFNENGEITSLLDKRNNREVYEKPSNILNVYEDNGDAWDMEEGYLSKLRGKFKLDSVCTEVINGTAKRVQTLVYGDSKLTQIFTLQPNGRILDVNNHIKWNESYKFLKAAFYPDIRTDFVNCNIQFGNLKRSVKKNNHFELAQIEICSHKYIDLSEGNYGVALLNNCKYGYHIEGNELMMSILRSPNYPGINADKGEHDFKFAIYPHTGCFENSDVVEQSYIYNSNKYDGYNIPKFIEVESDSAVIESIKKAEESNAVIIRLYESKGVHSTCELKVNFDFARVFETTINEQEIQQMNLISNCIKTDLKPYEIKTIKFEGKNT